jgi:hypothetical protein
LELSPPDGFGGGVAAALLVGGWTADPPVGGFSKLMSMVVPSG